jgi:PAS domain S-box-containing protein
MDHREEEKARKIEGLRERAEKMLGHQTPADGDLDVKDLHRIVHELHVHQAELEMQNDELLRSREETERSHRDFADLYELAPVGYFTLSQEGLILRVNQMGSHFTGHSGSKLINKPFRSFINSDEGPVFYSFIAQVFATNARQSCELSLLSKTGQTRFVHAEAQAMTGTGSQPHCLLALIDITAKREAEQKLLDSEATLQKTNERLEELVQQRTLTLNQTLQALQEENEIRRQMQEALTRSEVQYRILTESIPAMIWSTDRDGNMEFVNQWMLTYTGSTFQELSGSGYHRVLHPDDLERAKANFAQAVKTGEEYTEEIRFRRTDGQYFWHLRRIAPLVSEAGTIEKWIGINTDIHAQKQVEATLRDNQQLRDAQRKLKAQKEFSDSLLENNVDGVVAFDPEGCITAWNKRMEELNGKKRDEVLGHNLFDLFPEYHTNQEGEAVRRALRGESSFLRDHPYGIRKGFFEVHTMPLYAGDQLTGGLSIVHDVTERKKNEEERLKMELSQQKLILEAILTAQEGERKRIAEGLHNGLGQVLYAARLNLDRIQLNRLPGAPEGIAEARRNVEQLLTEAIGQTRSLSHELTPSILDDFGLSAGLRDICQKLTSTQLKLACQLHNLPESLDKYVQIAIYRMAQELANNIVRHSGASHAVLRVALVDDQIVIQAKDNGKGIESDQTKNSRKKGIGLKSIQDRVKLLNGSIDIQSEPEEGTQITIAFPML